MRRICRFSTAAGLMLVAGLACSQQLGELIQQQASSPSEGWQGFTDFGFLLHALSVLVLAAILGATIGHHPKLRETADTLEEIEAPKVHILYAVIGAIIGIMVVKYGLVIGFVVFGIGGLIRFRTVLQSASLTGHVIFVTLIGLSCGLDLPHVAVLATIFGFVLIYLLDARMIYRVQVRGLLPERVPEAAAAYRAALEQQGCRIVNEKKNPAKEQVTFIFHGPRYMSRETLEHALEGSIDPSIRGSVDWEVD